MTLLVLLLALAAGGAAASEPSPDAWPLSHHDLEVRLDPTGARIEVLDRVRLTAAARAGLPYAFLLHRDLALESARWGEHELEREVLERWRPRDFYARPDYAALGGHSIARQHRLLPPPGGWPPGELEIELRYSGAVYDSLRPPDVAYGRGFETTSGLVDPRGAYLHAGTFWVPWSGDGRFTFRMRTELPAPWHSMSQGARVEHGSNADTNVSVWQENAPQESIYLIAGPYEIETRSHAGVELMTYTYADTGAELRATYLDAAARYLDRYGALYGPYPFAKWALVENWWQTGFGMPGFTLLGDRVIRLPFIVDTSYGHEILHCWWGNGVQVEYAGGNWCEGLTAFGADYAYEREESEAAARDYRRNALVGYLDFASSGERDFALRDFRERSDFGTQAIGYGKSLMVFHMLESELGPETFGDGLRTFYRQHLHRPAGWDDLRRSFETVSGRDLGAWFAQWIDRVGAPQLGIESAAAGASAGELVLVQRGGVYELSVPVVVESAGGTQRLVVPVREERVRVALPPGTRAVSVDPDFDLFRRLHRQEIPPTNSQTLGADSTLVVIGSECEPELAEAYRAVAQQWARNQDMLVVEEEAAAVGGGRALFLLGPGPAQRRAFAATAGFGDDPARLAAALAAGRSVVYTVRDPRDAQRGWTVILASDAEAAAAIGRKLPHYSKYSWLEFEGTETVGKGQWTVTDSPMRATFAREDAP